MITIRNKKDYKGKGECIGRPSPLGNPFPLWSEYERDNVLEKYEEWLRSLPRNSSQWEEINRLKEIYTETGELDLICWCAPKACHGDIIKKIILEMLNELSLDENLEELEIENLIEDAWSEIDAEDHMYGDWND